MTKKTITQAILSCHLAVFLILSSLISGWAVEPESVKKISADSQTGPLYKIGPGDLIEILVWKEPDLSRIFSVRIDGWVSIPLLGEVQAAGKSIPELATFLEKRYREVISEPTVSVILNESKSWRYYVIGEVQHSGGYPLDTPITVLQALARSGGFQEWAKTDEIKIFRSENDTVLEFNFKSLTRKNDPHQDIPLRPGDTILVP